MASVQVVKDNYIRIGDYVTLKFLKHNTYLSAEGILVEDVFVSSSLKFFEENLFQIYTQRQYSATNELEEFMSNFDNENEKINLDQASKNHMEALIKGKENETILNKTVMKNKSGNILFLGDTIQLLHVKSGKFINVQPTDLARDERENMKVSLSADGSVMSWLKILPRYKINREGEHLTNNIEILLKVIERSNEYLHCSDRSPPRGKLTEVNSCLDTPTPFRIQIFQRTMDMITKPLLLTGQLVYIKDPESQSVIAPLLKPLQIETTNIGIKRNNSSMQFDASQDDKDEESNGGNISLEETSLNTLDEFVSENSTITLKPAVDESMDTNAIWMMEWKGITKGGVVKFRTDKVHFRHFNTGKYLSIRGHDSNQQSDGFKLYLDDNPNENDTLFSINQLYSNEDVLMNTRAVQLKHGHTGMYIERGQYNDSQKVYTCLTSKAKGKAVSIIINRYEQRDKIITSKALSRSSEEVLDIYFGDAVMQHLNRFIKAVHLPSSSTNEANTIWPRIDIADRGLFSIIMMKTSLFVKGYGLDVFDKVPSEISKIKVEKAVVLRRQNMFRELGLVEAMLKLLKMLIPISDWMIAESSHAINAKSHRGAFMEVGKQVLNECFNLLYELIKSNINNQLYISDHLLVILSHISTDKMAARVAQELLSSNKELQETKIGLKEITIFADKMREIPMNSMYLQLLQTCCSCLGQGLPKNQDTILSVVFNSYSDVLITMTDSSDSPSRPATIDTSAKQLAWDHLTPSYELYIAPHVGKTYVRGETLLERNTTSLYVKWGNNKQNRYSALRLFHKEIVSLRELFRSFNLISLGGKKDMRRDSEKAVGEFFIAQLNLVAEMCLDRNYNVITTMEKVYSYESLITILKSVPTDFLQRAAAYLLQVLYIDREPQSMVHLPRLTRTMSEIIRSGPLDFVRVEGHANYQFALIQSIISSHLAEIAGKCFSHHTHQLMKILQKLIIFNFYGELNKLKETTTLLVSCLVRDDFDIQDNSMDGSQMNMMRLSIHYKQSFKGRSGSKRGSRKSSEINGSIEQARNEIMNEQNKDDEKSTEFTTSNKSEFNVAGLLDTFESITVQTIIMCLVLVFCGATIYFYISSASYLPFFELGVVVILFNLYATHLVLYVLKSKEIFSFLSSSNNVIDTMTLLLYATYFIDQGKNAYHFAKFFELIKLPMLIKLVLDNLSSNQSLSSDDNAIHWTEPDRYILTSETTIDTLVKIVQILCAIQKNSEDHSLSTLLKAYMKWMGDSKSNSDTVYECYMSVIDNTAVYISNNEYDDIYIDLLMYSHPELMQVTLELLMIHHSSQKILMDNANKMQLIVSAEGEEQYSKMEQVLNILKRDADCHELWGKLKTPEHRKINTDILRYLKDLTETCRKQRQVLKFDETYEPVKSNQNILRNLGCFELCIKLVHLIDTIDKNDPFAPHHMNTRNLALHANQLLYWFIIENQANQVLAYSKLKFLIKTIDEKIDSHKVISAIFLNNLPLMESVPKKYISEFVELICHSGRCPQYLSLMASIITMGEKNVIENQYEVIKLMSSPENVKKVSQYFVSLNHPDYAKKLRLMAPFLNQKDVSVDSLPPDLAYHLELLQLLSRCTVGREGMTTIEAKVQSMFNFVDIIEAILDSNCLLLAKIRLGIHLFNAMLDVETLLPALKDSDCIWRLIISTQDVFAFAKDELRQIEKNGWENPTSNRQSVEFMIVCVKIINAYFSAYYDFTIFRLEIGGQIAVGVERLTIKENQANDIIKSIYLKISAIYEMLSPLLPEEYHIILFQTLCTLNDASKEKIVATVDNLHESFFKMAYDYNANNDIVDGNAPLGKSYDDFITAMNNDLKIKDSVDSQIQGFITKIEQIPWKSFSGTSNIRFEPLIQKLVSHITSGVQVIMHGDEIMKYIEPGATKTDIWMIRIFRTMVENRWGMTIYERDDDGGEEQDDAVVELMKVYNESGITNMCLDLISKGIDLSLQSEAIKLLVAMLFKEGGALDIQKTIYKHLSEPGSELFFRNVRSILHNLISWHKWNGVVLLESEEDEPKLPEEIIVVRCLQLMCEGHFQPNQDIFREQSNNLVSINLLDDLVLYLQALDNIKCRTSTAAETAVLATVLEVIQGPCEGNQDYFALQTELVETLNRKIRQHPINDCDEIEEMELKKSMLDILQALLEGQGHKTAVYERMLSVIHIDVIFVLTKEPEPQPTIKGTMEEPDEAVDLRTEAMVLLQMLTDFRPSLRKELGISEDISQVVSDTVGCIEVVWRGELQRRFFHIPSICHNLAKSTKDSFVLNVHRASPEDKLYGLLEATKEMYREILQQERLSELKIEKIFSKTNQDRVSWLSFYVVLVINILFTIFYRTDTVPCNGSDDTAAEYTYAYDDREVCSKVSLQYSAISLLITILTAILITCSFFVLLLYLVVRVPVNYQTYIEANEGFMNSILYTAMDPYTMYYLFYLFISITGFFYHAALTFLLLDFITKSPTSQAVLRAVYNPRMQIFMTFVLIMIVIYIFAFFQFFFFNNEKNFSDIDFTSSILNTFKFLIRLGLPYGSPANYMEPTISTYRVFNDLAFFISIMLLLNILKGITIDTFVELRKKLEERVADTTEICFICGIEKNTFNRTLDREAFDLHIKVDQNLWNYIYFIIFLWQQDKDDDDGLETFVRKCVENNDLVWFPLRKAIRLAEHQEKGDVNSIKYKFRKDLINAETTIASKMFGFKDQLNRTITRVEKSLEYETGNENKSRNSTSQRQRKPFSASLVNNSNITNNSVDNKSIISNKKDIKSTTSTTTTTTTNEVAHYYGALEADQQRQMHLKVVSIIGLDSITKSQLNSIFVRVISAHDETLYYPASDIAHTITNYQQMQELCEQIIGTKEQTKTNKLSGRFRSSYPDIKNSFRTSSKETQYGFHSNPSLIKFDFHNSPHHLVHQGLLPQMDLSKITVTVQILYQNKTIEQHSSNNNILSPIFLAGITIPLVELLNKAHFGELLHVPFHQKYIEQLHGIPSTTTNILNINKSTTTTNNNSKVNTSSSIDLNIDKLLTKEDMNYENDEIDVLNVLNMQSNICYITLSSIVSNDLEIEWDELLQRT